MTDDAAAQTLFHPFAEGLAVLPPGPFLFTRARTGPWLSALTRETTLCIQPLQPEAGMLARAGWKVAPAFGDDGADFAAALVLWPKTQDEARHDLARAARALRAGGLLAAAATNDAGGRRIEGAMKELGLAPQKISKNKAQVCWASCSNLNRVRADEWIAAGGFRPVADTGLQTCAGLFSADHADAGSLLLQSHLPADLSGRGADFGCGYGLPAVFAARHCPAISHLTLIDHDARALEACRRNMEAAQALPCTYLWHDLQEAPPVAPGTLDFVFSNPPFHQGHATLPALGRAFIRQAALLLKPGGKFHMVANTHLAYEQALEAEFSTHRRLHQAQGFKILEAIK